MLKAARHSYVALSLRDRKAIHAGASERFTPSLSVVGISALLVSLGGGCTEPASPPAAAHESHSLIETAEPRDGTPPTKPASTASQAERVDGLTLDEWRERMKNLNPADDASAAAVPGMIRLVEDESIPWFTRRQAALTLGRIGAPADAAVPVLIGLLDDRTTGEEATPFWAMKGLALFGTAAAEAGPALVDIARDAGRPVAQREASLEALSQIGASHPQAIPTLIAAVEGRLSPEDRAEDREVLRKLAAEALTALGPAAAPAAPALIRASRDPSEFLRMKAAAALGAMGGHAEIAVPALVELLVLDESGYVRDAAGAALAGVGPAARPALVHLLGDRSSEVRGRAAKSLGGMGPAARPVVPALRSALEDEDPVVQITAAEALWAINARAEPLLSVVLDKLTCEDRAIRIRAARLLLAMGRRAAPALPALRRLAEDERPYVRQAAEKSLRDLEAVLEESPAL